MYTQSATFTNEMGLNSRFATFIIQKTRSYQSRVSIEYSGKKADGKSLLGVLSLGVVKGAEIQITADGPDETVAVDTLCEMIRNADVYANSGGNKKQKKVRKRPGILNWLPFFRVKEEDDEAK